MNLAQAPRPFNYWYHIWAASFSYMKDKHGYIMCFVHNNIIVTEETYTVYIAFCVAAKLRNKFVLVTFQIYVYDVWRAVLRSIAKYTHIYSNYCDIYWKLKSFTYPDARDKVSQSMISIYFMFNKYYSRWYAKMCKRVSVISCHSCEYVNVQLKECMYIC